MAASVHKFRKVTVYYKDRGKKAQISIPVPKKEDPVESAFRFAATYGVEKKDIIKIKCGSSNRRLWTKEPPKPPAPPPAPRSMTAVHFCPACGADLSALLRTDGSVCPPEEIASGDPAGKYWAVCSKCKKESFRSAAGHERHHDYCGDPEAKAKFDAMRSKRRYGRNQVDQRVQAGDVHAVPDAGAVPVSGQDA